MRSAMQFFHLHFLPLALLMGMIALASALPVADAKADPIAHEPRGTGDIDIDFSDRDGMSPLQSRRASDNVLSRT